MKQTIFITGIGTGVGKTLVSAILAEALQADYWKPVQAGYADGTDSEWLKSMISNSKSIIHPEIYKLKKPASPHIAAREEGITINLNEIDSALDRLGTNSLIVEGAGGLMVPLNENEFVLDLAKRLKSKIVLVSRNYLGSINHSLLTAAVCKQHKLDVLGWIFTDQSPAFGDYENEIVNWSGYPKLASIANLQNITKQVIATEAVRIKQNLLSFL